MSWKNAGLEDEVKFLTLFEEDGEIGRGSDGIVTACTHRHTAQVIVVKTPLYEENLNVVDREEKIMREIRSLKVLGKHDHISALLTFSERFADNIGPAIFFQLCDLGDLDDYAFKWCCREKERGRPGRLAEGTILKLLHDVGLGLDYLHNGLSIGYVHIDLKPQNILVLTPPDHTGKDIPTLPHFKITDFARLTTYPLSPGKPLASLAGTYLYAPPLAERTRKLFSPTVDMWALGATIQCLALQIKPRQSRAAFVADRVHKGQNWPRNDEEWRLSDWREIIPDVYRPLDATAAELLREWDVGEDLPHHHPYSKQLNIWYKALFEVNPRARLTSAQLKQYLVPLIDQQLAIEEKLLRVRDGFAEAGQLRDGIVGRGPRDAGTRETWKEEGERVPSYEGNGYESDSWN
jgi:serine/threonine protein kinase